MFKPYNKLSYISAWECWDKEVDTRDRYQGTLEACTSCQQWIGTGKTTTFW